jgi:hypothetical protein
MYIEYLSSSLQIRQIDFHKSVKSPGPNECRIQQVLAIGGSHHNDILASFKPIHLHQDLVQGVVSFIVGSMTTASFPSHCVDFVNEDYGGGLLFGCCE